MMNVEAFRSSLKKGVARNNLFKVILPSITTNQGTIDPSTMNLMCRAASLPGRQMNINERIIGIPKPEKVVNGFQIDDMSMTFIMTNDYEAKRYFDAWTSLTMNFDSYELKYKFGSEGYAKQVTIIQLNSRGQEIYECKLEDAFPTTVNAIEFTNEQGGVVELNVQLSYYNWEGRWINAPDYAI